MQKVYLLCIFIIIHKKNFRQWVFSTGVKREIFPLWYILLWYIFIFTFKTVLVISFNIRSTIIWADDIDLSKRIYIHIKAFSLDNRLKYINIHNSFCTFEITNKLSAAFKALFISAIVL